MKKKDEISATVRAKDDAGEWSTLDVSPSEYACLKSAGIRVERDRRHRQVFKGPDPYAFVDKIMEMPPSACEEIQKKAEEEIKYLQDRLERLQEKKARIIRDIDSEVDICADRLKEMHIIVGVCDEIMTDETPGPRKPISELSDDEVPFDEGLAGDESEKLWADGDNTYFENIEGALAEERILDSCWPPPGEPVY